MRFLARLLAVLAVAMLAARQSPRKAFCAMRRPVFLDEYPTADQAAGLGGECRHHSGQ